MEHKITSTIITLNEERNIGRCIDALLPISDEIIVLDSFSTDRTKEICSAKNVHFEQREWQGYANAKNYLNQLASNAYIFSVDADEAPDRELQDEVLKHKEKGFIGTYSVNRKTNYCGSWITYSGWYPDIKTRIFPKNESQWVGEFVHEELVVNENPTPKQLNGHLLHYSYYSHSEHRERADKYSTLTAKKMNKKGKKASFAKPYLSAFARFFTMYFLKIGFLDGVAGFHIARISALSNIFKYQQLRKMNRE